MSIMYIYDFSGTFSVIRVNKNNTKPIYCSECIWIVPGTYQD